MRLQVGMKDNKPDAACIHDFRFTTGPTSTVGPVCKQASGRRHSNAAAAPHAECGAGECRACSCIPKACPHFPICASEMPFDPPSVCFMCLNASGRSGAHRSASSGPQVETCCKPLLAIRVLNNLALVFGLLMSDHQGLTALCPARKTLNEHPTNSPVPRSEPEVA